MTTLYRPVLIESAEQAEALPVGTIAYRGEQRSELCTHLPRPGWENFPWRGRFGGLSHSVVVGMTALVPIEAEEEVLINDTFGSREQVRRFTTPWQRFTEPSPDRRGGCA